MQDCTGVYHRARQLQAKGDTFRVIAPQAVKPCVNGNRNDATDAEVICQMLSRPGMRFVAIRTVSQQDIQVTHRIRSKLISQCTRS